MKNLLDCSIETLTAELEGQPSYRALQILQWVHQRRVFDFSQMSNLPKVLQQQLSEQYTVSLPRAITVHNSADGTRKWLLALEAGNAVEMVFIPEKNRGTLCVSSQVGCLLDCRFCATGKQGFSRNLHLSEIIGQLLYAQEDLAQHPIVGWHSAVTNVVFMGMGEPLLNYEAVRDAIALMLDDHLHGLSKYRVTVSTAGVVDGLKRLKQDTPAALAISLHAPDDLLRNKLVPVNRKYPLATLLPVLADYFADEPKRRVTIEYVMLDGINDSLQHAKALSATLQGIRAKINLIPFNPFKGTEYRCSPPHVIASFRDALQRAGWVTTIRKTRGDDNSAACGQLEGAFTDRTRRRERWKVQVEQRSV